MQATADANNPGDGVPKARKAASATPATNAKAAIAVANVMNRIRALIPARGQTAAPVGRGFGASICCRRSVLITVPLVGAFKTTSFAPFCPPNCLSWRRAGLFFVTFWRICF